jgi:hypothetical protein
VAIPLREECPDFALELKSGFAPKTKAEIVSPHTPKIDYKSTSSH